MRRNPLLMTVMGNPRTGPRTQKGAEKILDAAIGQAWAHLMHGVQVPIMDIPRIFRDIKLEMAGGLDVWAAVKAVGSRYRVNHNPCHGGGYRANPFILIDSATNKIIRTWRGDMTSRKPWDWATDAARRLGRSVFVVAHPYVPPTFRAGVEVSPLFYFGGPYQMVHPDGTMGRGPEGGIKRNGWTSERKWSPSQIWAAAKRAGRSSEVDRQKVVTDYMATGQVPDDVMDVIHSWPASPSKESFRNNPGFAPAIAGSIAGSLVAHAMSNPGGPQFIVIDSQDGTVMYTKRATGMGNEAINSCVEVARRLAKKNGKSYIVYLDLQRMVRGSQVNVGWARIMGITEEIHPDGSSTRGNPRRRARMCEHGRVDKRRCPGCRSRKHPRELTAMCPHGVSEGRRCRSCVPFKANGARKVTMPIEKFAKLVKARNDPALWRDFVAKCKAYHKWSHGTWPKKATIEAINKPGMKGIWISFDMGREPEKTYVMPKGTKRKGAWKHPWETMPQLRGDAEAGFILTKLGKGNRLSDFLHGN